MNTPAEPEILKKSIVDRTITSEGNQAEFNACDRMKAHAIRLPFLTWSRDLSQIIIREFWFFEDGRQKETESQKKIWEFIS